MLVNNVNTGSPYKEGDLYVYQGKQYSIETRKFKVKSITENDKAIKVDLICADGSIIPANFWKNSNNPNMYKINDHYALVEISEGDIVDFTGFEYIYNGFKQFNPIGGYRLSEDTVWSFTASMDTDKVVSVVATYLASIKEEALRNACSAALQSFMFDLIKKPAANKHHHNYIGGLLQHTAEVMTFAYNIGYCLQCDLDVIIAASFFHDIMKIEEYTDEGNYTPYGTLIGHVVGSAECFRKFAEQNNVTREKIDAITHCILAHHGRKEWGSPVEPQSVEAAIVHEADMLSSRVNPIFMLKDATAKKDYYNKW